MAGLDESFCGEYVYKLDECNFEKFIHRHDVVAVMFQTDKTFKEGSVFYTAATTTERPNHAYATVDCNKQKSLCSDHGVGRGTVFKIYKHGHLCDTLKNLTKYTALKQAVERS